MTGPAPAAPGFSLDRFQLEAIAALDQGRSVLVAAPTGSGKTVVAEAAIDLALSAHGKAFYTTPIKALSNQKYGDLCRRLGSHRVGLLTGDNAINGDAPVVVMTTEVLRNMIYASSPTLDGLHVVVLDEVHYLQDAYRGPVWEEVIIHLPPAVRLVCLSATVSNAAELGEWVATVRGPTDTVIETERPVELTPLYLVGDRSSEHDQLIDVLVDGEANPEGARFDGDPRLARKTRGKVRQRYTIPRRADVVERLRDEDLLPAIYFIFSRAACDDALAYCRDAGIRLTTSDERTRIRSIVEDHVSALSDDDLDVLGYDLWLAALEVGIASHHAGMIPAFKEATESCFTQGLVKVVFATETLALGINMPARSVVIEKLTKYNGESHEFLTAGEFTQLTGRAGRRGIDDEGYAVVVWSPFVTFGQVASLATSRDFPLRSSFRPTYNMAVNLIRRYERDEALAILGRSFAQFQADRALVTTQVRLNDDQVARDRLADAAHCEKGDVAEYASLLDQRRAAGTGRRSGQASVDRSLAMLRPGDVIAVPGTGSPAVVISVAFRSKRSIRVRTVDQSGDVVHLDPHDIAEPVHAVATVELPSPYAPGDPVFLDECARRLSGIRVDPPARRDDGPSARELLEVVIDTHPVHRCPDRDAHLEAHRTLGRLEREMSGLRSRLAKATNSVVHRFEAVVDLLVKEGFAHDWALTAAGERLARLYHECDLLLAQALDQGIFDGLGPADLAALVSTLTYEERRSDAEPVTHLPTAELSRRFDRLSALSGRLGRAERSRGLPQTRGPDPGFMAVVRSWAAGDDLAEVLEGELPAGDFVRNVKVLVDLLGQLSTVAPDPDTRRAAGAAADAISRGVVAASSEVTTAIQP